MLFGTALASNASGDGGSAKIGGRAIGDDMRHVVAGSGTALDRRHPARECAVCRRIAYLEIDKLPDGTYRATVGTLFEFQEICRRGDLEALVRHANAMAGCRSFDDVVNAFRAMRTLG